MRLEHRFVGHIPEKLDPGVLYVSMEYATAAHSCCCGCGEEVVTPFTPTDWKMTFDGDKISLLPSIGSWTLPCRSHYVIDRGKVIEAGPWTDEQVAVQRRRDRAAKARYYGTENSGINEVTTPPGAQRQPERPTLLQRARRWLFG
ncbi:DUF6527 family protein [Arenibaculum pallidiluteum]|uniref:DUF6527 family protein n=1 Tax=Arenibaculum pallidiluteum TaxID=2812559 RepID=UPI001A9726D9|nr:DUF6527 family protein [Arenibaculum pallidiluteum]